MRTLNQIMESLERSIELRAMEKAQQRAIEWLDYDNRLENCECVLEHLERFHSRKSEQERIELIDRYVMAYNEMMNLEKAYLSQDRAPH